MSDSEAIAALHRRSFETAWNESDFDLTLADPHITGLLALEAHHIMGCLVYRTVADEAEILTLFVIPEAQRKGIGKALLTHCIAELKQAGIAMLYLEVPENNEAALKLYVSCGFKKTGKRRGYYKLDGKPVDAILMHYTI